MLKQILFRSPLIVALFLLAACGGGGGGSSSTPVAAPAPTYSKAIVKVALVGTLPAGSAISGTSFALFLKPELTPEVAGGSVVAGVVSPSGTFASGTQLTDWTPPNATTPTGKMMIDLADTTPAGVTLVGEVATITLQLVNKTAPSAGSYVLAPYGVADLSGNPIPTLQATIAEVILQ